MASPCERIQWTRCTRWPELRIPRHVRQLVTRQAPCSRQEQRSSRGPTEGSWVPGQKLSSYRICPLWLLRPAGLYEGLHGAPTPSAAGVSPAAELGGFPKLLGITWFTRQHFFGRNPPEPGHPSLASLCLESRVHS